jgi:glycine dehydrogenase subunit 2
MSMTKLLFEKSIKGSNSFFLPPLEFESAALSQTIPEQYLRQEELELPELSEVEVVRHFTALSHRAFGIDDGFYPLGSCTMKYNPKINEWAARLPGFAGIHPYQAEYTVQGAMELLYKAEKSFCEIAGMDRFTLQPAAGAHGELTGVMIIKAYHQDHGDQKRSKMLIPDSAHGTNPATANMLGFEVVEIKSNSQGLVDLADLRSKMNDEVAGLMLTNPNTLGLFEQEIKDIAAIVHSQGGLLYYDGANLNAIAGVARPGDMGFDVVHLNLHKTFSTPHGGGGPGSGPVGVKQHLTPFLPVPLVEFKAGNYYFDYDRPKSLGRVKEFYGNFGVIVRAYCYILALGGEGLRSASENAVLNANYLRHHLADDYLIPYNRLCKHEFVATSQYQMESAHISTLDIAKRLMDYGYHPPTIYFPLIVKEAMMIEPTETESRERLDEFIEAMRSIAREAQLEPDKVKNAPHSTVIVRVDEVAAARHPIVKWEADQ